MIRAVLLDFYGVWAPDRFGDLIAAAEQKFGYGSDETNQLVLLLEKYYHGEASLDEITGAFRIKLERPDIDATTFSLHENDISPAVASFMRGLHEHFVKVGILANLGEQEYQLLQQFNQHNQAFEMIGGPLPFITSAPLLSQDVFSQALNTIGEPPKSCLAVSGNDAYLNFAQSLGISTIKFEGFPKLSQALAQMIG